MKSTLDYRYLYLMEQRNQGLISKMFGGRKIKIGISKTPKKRAKAVDKAFGPNRVIEVDHQVKVLRAERHEKRLHAMFSDTNYNPKRVGRSGGRTEWFKVNCVEYWCLRFWMALWRLKTLIYIWAFRVLMLGLALYLVKLTT